jgi:branched-chain amino acid transport system substrate-binding protein
MSHFAPWQTRNGRRQALKTLGALAGAAAAPSILAQGNKPIRIGFQVHRTGIGATYGRWYERTTAAAVKAINDAGGIAGRPVEIVAEDDGTDPKRGPEVVEKLARQHKVDFVYGTLFSHVVIASAPRAGELKIPYFVVSEGYHVASGKMNRYVVQPGITDVRAQVTAMSSWVLDKLAKKVTMIYPDYAFGYDHRDFFTAAAKKHGGQVIERLAIPPTESSFTKYFARVPKETEVLYHVMVGPGVLTFVKEMGEHFGKNRPQIFGFIDSLEAVAIDAPGLEFLEGTHFWEGHPRYKQPDASEHETFYREAVGVDDDGASVSDPKDVSTYAHMFSAWETLFVIKAAMEAADYQGPDDRQAFVEAIEAMTEMPASREHPQGDKVFNGKTHQVFGHQHISVVEGGRMNVVHTTSIEDGLYEDEVDYTTMAF